ncbi:Hypothetical protein I596_3029 [Dokdonella koreensis DS-123]|uniref:Uncharacterized protein n=1 Tax=Dokdonella koreensis DS-123 TaxID=1300342 RepID=A0A160DXJ3_9GAMM|nr:Hypothetical protein I596_3029 [Dokdonella koreensis DS-123]
MTVCPAPAALAPWPPAAPAIRRRRPASATTAGRSPASGYRGERR